MERSLLVKLILVLVTASMLSACLMVPVEGESRGGGSHERGHGDGDHRGDRHEGSGDRR